MAVKLGLACLFLALAVGAAVVTVRQWPYVDRRGLVGWIIPTMGWSAAAGMMLGAAIAELQWEGA